MQEPIKWAPDVCSARSRPRDKGGGGGGHPDPSIGGRAVSFDLKIRGGGPSEPLPWICHQCGTYSLL